MYTVIDIAKSLKKDVELKYFGKAQEIQLSEHNVIYIDSPAVKCGCELSYGQFRRNIYYYSELMNTPCRALLPLIEMQAKINAMRGGKTAKNNLQA